jgi:glutathione peroxidase
MQVVLSMLCLLLAAQVAAAADLQDIPLSDIHGQPASLKDYAGKVVLPVNVASKCGDSANPGSHLNIRFC